MGDDTYVITSMSNGVSPVRFPHLRSNSGPITVQLGISLDVVGVYC